MLPSCGIMGFYDRIVMNTIDGLRAINDQIDAEIVRRQGEMGRVADDRDRSGTRTYGMGCRQILNGASRV